MYSEKSLKKICLITPGHISTNPRLVKEAITLLEHNYKVHIIFTQYTIRQIQEDFKILSKYPEISFDILNWSGNTYRSLIVKIISGLKQRVSSKLVKLYPILFLKNRILNRNYNWQLSKAMMQTADLYIAHNLSALPIAIIAAKKLLKKAGFDAEDFHRFENSDDKANEMVLLNSFYEEKYMALADYLTAASPIIAHKYQKILKRQIPHILNVFPQTKFISQKRNDNKIKLFWFSQTIGPNRGLETIIESLSILEKFNLELNLLGEIDNNYKKELADQLTMLGIANDKLIFHETISPDMIPNFAQQFDIGIASELSTPVNRDICLTNKIFTYCQIGLAIVASNTKAQQELIYDNPGLGFLYEQNNASSLANLLITLCANEFELEQAKTRSFNYAKTKFNWELEQKKFICVLDTLWVK